MNKCCQIIIRSEVLTLDLRQVFFGDGFNRIATASLPSSLLHVLTGRCRLRLQVFVESFNLVLESGQS